MIKPNSAREVYFSASALKAGVDSAAGRINGVILMEGDREALGHGLWIDTATLESALASLPASGRILAYLHHPSMIDNIAGNGMDRFEDSVGYLEKCRIEDNCLKADLIFWDAYKADPESDYAKIMEMAATDASLINFSIEAYGYTVFVLPDGQEISADIDDAAADSIDFVRDIPSFRVTNLTGAALVSEGAATSSLFAAGQLKVLFAKMPKKATPAVETPAVTTPVSAAAAPFVDAQSNDMSLLKDISAKFASDAGRLARAVAIAAEPAAAANLSLADIETMLARQDEIAENARLVEASKVHETKVGELTTALAAKDGEIAGLKTAHETAIVELNGKVTAAEASAADWKAKFETIKTSGADPVVLGIPGAATKQPDEFSAAMDAYNSIPVSDSAARAKHYADKIAPLFKR